MTTTSPVALDERPPAPRRVRSRGSRLRSAAGPILAVAPAVVCVLLFLALPIAYGFWVSFLDTTLFDPLGGAFVGLANYTELFGDPGFRNALWRTLVFVFGVIALGMVQAFAFAITLHALPDWARWARALSLVPYFISSIAVAMVWRFFVQSEGGFTSFFSNLLGVPALSWLADPNLALIVVVVATTWTVAPFAVLVMLAGLQTVNAEMYDAAAVDGAGPLQTFVHITLPSLKPQIATSLIWLTFQAFNSFGLILALTGGGPNRATEVLAIFMYSLGLQSLDISASSAVLVIILVLNGAFSFAYLKLLPQEGPAGK